jgi:hypothetical protein
MKIFINFQPKVSLTRIHNKFSLKKGRKHFNWKKNIIPLKKTFLFSYIYTFDQKLSAFILLFEWKS